MDSTLQSQINTSIGASDGNKELLKKQKTTKAQKVKKLNQRQKDL